MDKKKWQKLRDQTLTQPLLKTARIYNEKSIELLRTKYDLPHLRVSHTTLMRHIDLDGTRQTEIAKRLNVSKQAIGPLIEEMVAMGALKLIPDPKDKRAKLVTFNFEGSLTPTAALDVADIMEKKIAKKLGKKKTSDLKALLWEALQVIDD